MTLKQITAKLSRATHSWEVEDELQALWSLGDHGDLNAFTLYGLALLMEGKGWYDLEEGRLALENAAKDGCSMAQYYLGRFYLEARVDHDADPVIVEILSNRRRAFALCSLSWTIQPSLGKGYKVHPLLYRIEKKIIHL